MTARPTDLEAALVAVVRSSSMLCQVLHAARDVGPPDWLIGAGVVRDYVWARLHGLSPPLPRDIDLAFYDPSSRAENREEEVLRELCVRAPGLPWETTNEARAHLWYPRVYGVTIPPFRSAADAVAAWPETATAVAVHLTAEDCVRVVAPFGLGDLFGMIWRHNSRYVPATMFQERTRSKRIAARWPRVRIIDAAPA